MFLVCELTNIVNGIFSCSCSGNGWKVGCLEVTSFVPIKVLIWKSRLDFIGDSFNLGFAFATVPTTVPWNKSLGNAVMCVCEEDECLSLLNRCICRWRAGGLWDEMGCWFSPTSLLHVDLLWGWNAMTGEGGRDWGGGWNFRMVNSFLSLYLSSTHMRARTPRVFMQLTLLKFIVAEFHEVVVLEGAAGLRRSSN